MLSIKPDKKQKNIIEIMLDLKIFKNFQFWNISKIRAFDALNP